MNYQKASKLIYYGLITDASAYMTVSEVHHDKVVFAVLAALTALLASIRLVQTIRQ
jgi:hypothetical protein